MKSVDVWTIGLVAAAIDKFVIEPVVNSEAFTYSVVSCAIRRVWPDAVEYNCKVKVEESFTYPGFTIL